MGKEREYEIHGPGITQKTGNEYASYLVGKEKEALTPMEGEIEKTPEQLEFIESINSYLKKEFEILGLTYEEKVLPERIHLFDQEWMEIHFPDDKNEAAFIFLPGKKIIINTSRVESKERLLKVLIHEIIHLQSFHSYFLDPGLEKLNGSYRDGYGMTNRNKKAGKDPHEHFRGFNEGMVDLVTAEITGNYLGELEKKFELVRRAESKEWWYRIETEVILHHIIEKIAEERGRSTEDVFREFEKNLFTGKMMFLRDIERVFGKGALRMLSLFHPSVISGKQRGEKTKQQNIVDYFSIDDNKEFIVKGEEREKLVREVLGNESNN